MSTTLSLPPSPHDAINEQTVGLSALHCERVRQIYELLGDNRQTCSWIAEKLNLTPGQCQTGLTAGGQVKVFHEHRRPNGRGGGCQPSLWSRNVEGVAHLAGAQRASTDKLLQSLGEQRIGLLSTFNWRKKKWRGKQLTLHRWRSMCFLIAAIRDRRHATYGELATDLVWSKGSVGQYVSIGRHLKILKIENPHNRWDPLSATRFQVDWSIIKKESGDHRISLETPIRGQRISMRPVAESRCDASQKELVEMLDKRMLCVDHQSDVVVAKKLLQAVGSTRIVSLSDLARELNVSVATVGKGLAAARTTGILTSRTVWDDDAQKKASELTTCWPVVKALVGERRPATNGHDKADARKPKVKSERGRKVAWPEALRFLLSLSSSDLRDTPTAGLRTRFRESSQPGNLPPQAEFRTLVSRVRRGIVPKGFR